MINKIQTRIPKGILISLLHKTAASRVRTVGCVALKGGSIHAGENVKDGYALIGLIVAGSFRSPRFAPVKLVNPLSVAWQVLYPTDGRIGRHTAKKGDVH